MDELSIFVDKEYTDYQDFNYNEYCEEVNLPKLKLCPVCSTNVFMNLICEIRNGDFHYAMLECPKCDAVIVKKYKDQVALLDYQSGMKYKDIAVKYGATINTVKSWKTRYQWSKDKKKGVHTKRRSAWN
ncbi:helix-turn-helix domain-containing protein [Lacrimispora sp.]|uniref:helix-turn-helix domain-containing protein n=1 Tax=Lacrimispora sp. TaxID=2719234 RepID=UPI003FA5B9C3